MHRRYYVPFFVIPCLLAATLLNAQAQDSKDSPEVKPVQYKPLNNAKYDNAGDFSEGLAPVRINDKWGFIDRTGKMVIAPQFNPWQEQFNAYFSEGLVAINLTSAKVQGKEGNDARGTRWGFADKTGKIVIPAKFEGDYYAPPHFSDGLAVIGGTFIGTTIATFGVHNKFGYIDKTGTLVIPQKYDEAYDFFEGMASVRIGEKYGFIDKTGKLVIAAMYDSPSYFKDGVAVVEINKLSFVIDKNNKKVFDQGYLHLGTFYEGLARFEVDGRIGFIDSKGNVKIKPAFEYGSPESIRLMYFSEGLCHFEEVNDAARNNRNLFYGRYGYINKDGKVMIPAQFNYAGPFKNGIAVVSMNGNYGYINKTGKFIIPPIFANAGYFIDGIARVSGGGSFGDYKYRFIKLN